MPKNIEVKARVRNVNKLLCKIKMLCDGKEGVLLVQSDTFYNANNGRLKLREFGAESKTSIPELIYYKRPDVTGTKLSDFVKVELTEPSVMEGIKQALSESIGVYGVVKKERLLFLPQPHVRIHVDKVENLGDFMEIEVCLINDMTPECGEKIIAHLLKKFEINTNDLISSAYMDIINKTVQ